MQEMQSVTQFVSRLRLTRREVTMELILDTQPYMLYETIAMLTKYVNRISMLDIRDTLLRLYRVSADRLLHLPVSAQELPADEVRLLTLYRAFPEEQRQQLMLVLETLSRSAPKPKPAPKPRQP